MKKIVLMAAAIVTLAACTSEDYLGNEDAARVGKGEKAISFSSSTGRVTRATGGDAATALGNSFNVYGVKKVGDTYSNVFAKNVYGTAADYNAQPYVVTWGGAANSTASNTSGWDYVSGDQTIKYWDYSANQYEFVAYKATEGSPTITKYQKDGFTVEATAAELAGLYIADKVTITEKNGSPAMPATLKDNKIGDIVQFKFRASATKVRLGIFTTIKGYVVKNVKFRPQGAEFDATTANAKLCGSFNGSSASAGADTYTVTYDATSGIAQLATATAASDYFDFGTFASSTSIGTSSTDPTWASGSADYQAIRPNTDHVGNMQLKVDYDLYNATTEETIHVKNARCVVPSIYMAWNPNYAYTYLFKISDNTNGTTGVENTSPEGLYPITFDAMTVETTDGGEVGTITTVSTPAITTYMEGSVSSTGITYATAKAKPIYVTVNTDGTLADLTAANLKLYTVPAGTTEADLVLASVTKTEVTGTGAITVPLAAAETVQGINFAAATTAKFVPAAAGTYAVEFTDASAVKHYKVIIVS
ncbi:MAG: hypothetical protein IJ539_03020 [Prevotella sp.]|nr:hypothetical protein [Prevotella sp.]